MSTKTNATATKFTMNNMKDNSQPVQQTTVQNSNISPTAQNSEISVREFLDFLKAAYQVHGNLEGVFIEEGMKDTAEWIKSKQMAHEKTLALTAKNHAEQPLPQSEDGRFKDVATFCDAAALQRKLSDILNEGLLDSVLPYMVPPTTTKKSSTKAIDPKPSLSNSIKINSSTESTTKRSSDNSLGRKLSTSSKKNDTEVEIHVCDELKNVRKDFRCNQDLLLSQMGYFAHVTGSAQQRLDEMEISVHCDIGVFEWLMGWVKRGQLTQGEVGQMVVQNAGSQQRLEDGRPVLTSVCAVPVLVSAAFLQMEPLLEECLLYCHGNMNDILKTNASMSCLNDVVLTRLAAMYTNAEVEAIRDKRDKLQSRLYCKLIQSLCEPEAEALRGHYCTLATIYRCKHCQQLIPHPAIAAQIPCTPAHTRLLCDGSVQPKHVRDPHWSITEHVASTYRQLRHSWRRTYWRLWSEAHHLYCAVCKRYFPAWQWLWCRYHPDAGQFFTLDNSATTGSSACGQSTTLPVGRYPCCGERAYRFQLLDERAGCQFREHAPNTKKIRDAAILSMLQTYKALIAAEPPQLVFPDRLTRLVAKDENDQDEVNLDTKETFWWQGLEILPEREKYGLLGSFVGIYDEKNKSDKQLTDENSETDDTTISDENTIDGSSSTSGSSTDESGNTGSTSEADISPGESANPSKRKGKNKKGRSKDKLWQHCSSARSNQDMQRCQEEHAFKKIQAILTRRTEFSESNAARNAMRNNGKQNNGVPPGGLWVKLEQDWRENSQQQVAPRQKNIYTGKIKMKTTRLL